MSGEKIFIIGGGAAGISAANRARRISENCEISIVEQSEYIGYPISALPLFISGKIGSKEILLSDYEMKLTKVYNINLLKKHEVVKIDKHLRKIYLRNVSNDIVVEKEYTKLIIACGSRFNISKGVSSSGDNFFKIATLTDAIQLKQYIEKFSPRNITILGMNYLSLNLANALLNSGFVITLVGSGNKILSDFDDEFNVILKEELSKSGIKIIMNNDNIKYIKNETSFIHKIELSKQTIDTQAVIYCDNFMPNSHLAVNAGLEVGKYDGILVNEKMQTSDKNIYACGSVIETINVITKKRTISDSLNLAEIQGRIAGTNAAGDDAFYNGITGTKFISFNKLKIGITGLNLDEAKDSGFNASCITIYNGNYERFVSGSTKLHVKIVIDNVTKKILGAQVCARGEGVDKRLDVFATAVYAGLTVSDLANLDFAYHPEISVYKEAVNVSGMVGENKVNHISDSVLLKDVDFNDSSVILDIRTKTEYQKEHLLNSLWIPLSELRERLKEVPKNKKIYIYGHVGLRGYVAERILKGNGIRDVYNIDGGITSIKILENIE